MSFITTLFLIIYYLETAISKVTKLKDSVDLTWPFDNETVYWTKNHPFVFTKKIAEVRVEGVWYQSDQLCAGEYGGTHFDAPYHYNPWGWKVGEIPLTRLIVRGIKIDVSHETAVLHDKALLLPEHLEEWEKENGRIPVNSVILVYFGWSRYYKNKMQYLGIDIEKNLHFPGISPAAARWITRSGNVVGVGVDTASIGSGTDKTFKVHKIFSYNQIYVLENVKIPHVFPDNDFVLYVMPMKISEGSGAPLRIVAIPFETGIIPPNLGAPTTPFYGHVIVVVSGFIILILQILTLMEM